MEQYIKPHLEIVELAAESSLLTASKPIPEDSAGFGEDSDEID